MNCELKFSHNAICIFSDEANFLPWTKNPLFPKKTICVNSLLKQNISINN